MILVIDGYNLLNYIVKKRLATEKERAQLVHNLTTYAQYKKHEILLVFDGGSYERPTFTKKGIISILYSGKYESADDVIKDYIGMSDPSKVALVSSDRALYSFASSLRVPTIDVAAFAVLLKERKSTPLRLVKGTGQAHKLHKEEINPELDTLMEEGSTTLLYKQEEEEKEQKTTEHKLSKEERKLLKLWKKL